MTETQSSTPRGSALNRWGPWGLIIGAWLLKTWEIWRSLTQRHYALGGMYFDTLEMWWISWWPRFERIARGFVAFEGRQRAAGRAVAATEVDGIIEIAGPAGPFALTARADRIDRQPGGGLRVVDYKTGQAPTWPMVKSGLVPQLSLEAAIAEAGGFEDLEAGSVEELAYLRLSGGRQPGEEKAFANDVATVTAEALDGLRRRITAYDDPETPYLSQPRPMFIGRFGDYDHLARVKEWLSGRGNGE